MILQIHAIDTVRMPSRRELRRDNVRFYRDLLKLPVAYSLCDVNTVVFRLRRCELRLEFTGAVKVNPHRLRALFEVDDLPAAYETLAANGHQPYFHRGYSLASRRVFVLDPTGYRIGLFQLWPLG